MMSTVSRAPWPEGVSLRTHPPLTPTASPSGPPTSASGAFGRPGFGWGAAERPKGTAQAVLLNGGGACLARDGTRSGARRAMRFIIHSQHVIISRNP
jgi:hypothetical protein